VVVLDDEWQPLSPGRRRPLDAATDSHYIEAIVAIISVLFPRGDVRKEPPMQVQEGMTPMILTVGPGHTLRDAARLMAGRRVGASVVIDPDGHGPGILTERDILLSVGAGEDPDRELVGEHLTREVVYAGPDWSLEEAAAAMLRGGFRHLIVVEGGETVGILSVRDIVRCWTTDGAVCPVPASAAVG
jgi:CBS domain-containing protein